MITTNNETLKQTKKVKKFIDIQAVSEYLEENGLN